MNLTAYFHNISKARYFWVHLVLSDLRIKYRRSFLGIAWAIIHPLMLTLLLSVVMGKMLHSPISDYAPYIFSGIILWEFVVTSANNGCHAFINAEGYIRQFTHPLAIYSLRVTLGSLINLLFASFGLMGWVLVANPISFSFSWICLPFSLILLFFLSWAISTMTALISVRFRDFSQMITILLQALWYVSPVLFLPSLFINNGLEKLLLYNPVYHFLNLFRAPLLEGHFPDLTNYLFALTTIFALTSTSLLFIKKYEKKVIFYL